MHRDLWSVLEPFMTLLTITRIVSISQHMRNLVFDPSLPATLHLSIDMMYQLVGIRKMGWRHKVISLDVQRMSGVVGLDTFSKLKKLRLHLCVHLTLPQGLDELIANSSTFMNTDVLSSCTSLDLDNNVRSKTFIPDNARLRKLRVASSVETDFRRACFSTLQELRMHIKDRGDVHIPELPCLRIMDLHGNSNGKFLIDSQPSLEKAIFNGMQMEMGRHPQLRELRLSCCNIDSIANQPMLKLLQVSHYCHELQTLCDAEHLIIQSWKPTYHATRATRVHIYQGEVRLSYFPSARYIQLGACQLDCMQYTQPKLSMKIDNTRIPVGLNPSKPFDRLTFSMNVALGDPLLYTRGCKYLTITNMNIKDQTIIENMITCENIHFSNVTIWTNLDLLPLLSCKKVTSRGIQCSLEQLQFLRSMEDKSKPTKRARAK